MTFGRLAGTQIAQNLGKPQGQVNGQSIKDEISSRRPDSGIMMDREILIGEGRKADD